MPLSIVTYADLGEKSNLKTAAISPVIQKFANESELKQVVCRINKNFHFKNTQSSTLYKLIHYFLRGIERFLPPRFALIDLDRKIFDYLSSTKLEKSDVVLFHPAVIFQRTLARAKKNKSITIGIGTSAHPQYIRELLEGEYKLLKIKQPETSDDLSWDKVIKEFDYFIALSDFVKKTYISGGFPEEKISVASLNIDTDKFQPAQQGSNKKFTVMFAASISVLRGLHYLLDAWEALALENAELLIAGNYGKLPRELEKTYRERIKNNSSIRFVGYSKNLKEYYNQSSVFVMPSLTEGFSKSVLEAMASGLSVITTENASGIVENNKTGFIVPIRDSKAIEDKIKFLCENPKERKRMGLAAREAVVTKNPFGEEVYRIYQEVLRRSLK